MALTLFKMLNNDTGLFFLGQMVSAVYVSSSVMYTLAEAAPNIVTITHEDGNLRSYFPMNNTSTVT
jgi:hypothetical protein